MEKIYILLPVHNRRKVTLCFITCLKAQTFQNYHLVLIDDGSTDGTENMVRAEILALTVIKGNGNWWWAGSLQHGYLWLKSQNVRNSDIVMIINDDTEFEPHFLETAANILKRYTHTLLLAQAYSQQTKQLIDPGTKIDWRRMEFQPALSQAEINCLSTRGLFLRYSDFIEINGFYPRLLPHYTSDYEFSIRASHKGFQLITNPTLYLWVNEDSTGEHSLSLGNPFNIFSRKSALNPIYLSIFILLACPWHWKLYNLLRVWKRTITHLVLSTMPNTGESI